MINNIFWVNNLNVIGGVETFIYELAKMVKDYDFVIYYNNIEAEQLKRLKKYVKCVKYKGEKLKCKKLFMNYDISIIDNVEAEEYIEIVHAVFTKNVLPPHTHDKITKYYAVGNEACEAFKKITGKECEVLHNPLNITKPRRVLRLISATRLAPDKGKLIERMQKLINALEENDIPYQWLIFSNSYQAIKGKGVVYMKPTLDIRDYIADSDYLVQLSCTEAFCYSVLETLYLNKPVIVTPIQCFVDDMGVVNGKNGYVLDYDMKDIPVFDIYNKIPKFVYQPFEDKWMDKIIKVEGNYKEELEMKVKVQATINFNDIEEGKSRRIGDVFECSKDRADYLLEHRAIKVLEEIKPEPELKKVVGIKDSENVVPLKEEALKEISKEIKKNTEKPKKKKSSKK